MMQTLPKIMQIANLIQEKERDAEGKPKCIIRMNYSAHYLLFNSLLSSTRVLKSPPPHPFPALIPFSLIPQKSHVINLKNVKQMLS